MFIVLLLFVDVVEHADAMKIPDDCHHLLASESREIHVRQSGSSWVGREGEFRKRLEHDFAILQNTPGIRGVEFVGRYGKANRSDESTFFAVKITFSGPPEIVASVLPQLQAIVEFELLPLRKESEIQTLDALGGVKQLNPECPYLQ